MTQDRIVVLAGGPSFEREVSLRSGSRVAEALAAMGWAVERRDLSESLLAQLAEDPPAAAVLALHGKAGEDGTVQSLLELLGIPYTGPDPSASALVWDKAVCKGVVSRAGVDTPEWATITSDAIRDLRPSRMLAKLPDALGSVQVVKPVRGGASMGVRVVDAPFSLNDALLTALSYDSAALIERHIAGTEVAVAVLDGEALPPVEIAPKEGGYDFAARYTPGATSLYAPARLDEQVLDRCRSAALRAWDLTGCRDIARADFVVTEDGKPWLLELDTCPGLTETSLVPVAVEAAGLSFEAFCDRLLRMALERGKGQAAA